MSENCQGAKFEILLDGKTQSCRDTMVTAMGAAKFIQSRIAGDVATVTEIPRGKYIGRRVGDPPKDEAEHFIRCPACGGWIDCRDLAQVFDHNGPFLHPAEDQPQ